MSEVRPGDTVRVHYTGKDETGQVFDSSQGREPLQFTVGQRAVIPGFEDAVVGMSPGDRKTVEITAQQAYGERRDDLMLRVDRQQVPPNLDLKEGDRLQVRMANGQLAPVTVAEVTDEVVVLDANHPLAGKDLTFDIELVEIGS
ncbi:MAG: peptidylprolyl isomerase [Anaerolineae bacterium]|nr:peptidylprolyl isomerase [Anaerolineae bacterium]